MNNRSENNSERASASADQFRRRGRLFAAKALLLGAGLLGAGTAFAQSNVDGAISGRTGGAGTVVVENPATGVRKSTTVGTDGSYRIGALPPGSYTVTYTATDGAAPETQDAVVNINTTTSVEFDDLIRLEVFRVSGSSINPIDFQKTESVTVLNERMLDALPIARNVNSVALLAPGTTLGDTAFGNLVTGPLISFGGASVAENAFFVNGFNISDFRTGTAPNVVPFEFYSQFEVKTGAYSAEFGRSTGGVVNAVTKSGTNERRASINTYYEPNGGRWLAPSSYYTEDGKRTPLVYNGADYTEVLNTNVSFSGPIIEDKLFYHVLYNVRKVKDYDVTTGGSRWEEARSDDPFWGVKIDAIPLPNHRLEYTAFRDKTDVVTDHYDYDLATRRPIAYSSQTFEKLGGLTQIGRYTGTFFEDLTVSALYGKGTANRTTGGTVDSQVAVYDTRTGHDDWLLGNPDLLVSKPGANNEDVREAFRFDVEYVFDFAGSHRLRAGLDREDNSSANFTAYSGNGYYRYYTVTPGDPLSGGVIPDGVTEVARLRVYEQSGHFSTKSNAYYVEDNWTLMSDRLNFRLGIRNEEFENLNSNGETFIKVKNQWAPRLGVSFDVRGDQKTKVFANWGRYHLPIAANTNIRMAGNEYFTQDYYVLEAINDDSTPVLGPQIGTQTVYANGEIPDPRTIVDSEIKPMFQDEIVIGAQHELTKNWTVGVRGIFRELKSAIDDVIIDHALVAYAARNNIADFEAPGAHAYVLTNPGSDISMFWDMDGDGTLDPITLTAEDLQFPEASRKYYAAELFVEKVFDGKWSLQASYTWSHNYGNTEGYVRSDNGQDDAGITSAFDSLGLMEGAYGNLPNDRRHQFKVFGAYSITDEIQVGANVLLQSGRPMNSFALHPSEEVAQGYGAEAFYDVDGNLVPRGSLGTTPWVFNVDFSVAYRPKWAGDRLTLGLDIFNILNRRSTTEVYELATYETGEVNPRFMLPTSWQTPRYIRLSASLDF